MKVSIRFAVLVCALTVSGLAFMPSRALALNPNHNCGFCHQLHQSPGGALNTAAQFDLICETCHGPAGTNKFVDRHVDPNNTPATWDLGCNACHTPHSELPNRYNFPPYVANTGDSHIHNHSKDAGGNVPGVNIKLMGRDEDGTGIAKVTTPLQILGEGAGGPCTVSNTELNIALPPFADGDGPPHTIMVGDRITVSNGGPDFTGTYRVKETNWDVWPTSGWVCFDHPSAPVATSGNGYLHSTGWHERPSVWSATWSGGVATLDQFGANSIQVGDAINVLAMSPSGYNGRYIVTAVNGAQISYVVADPGGPGAGGGVEYVGSVKAIQNAAIQGPPPPPPLLVTDASWTDPPGPSPPEATLSVTGHSYAVNDTVLVTGIVSTNNTGGLDNQGYNGTFMVIDTTANTLIYELPADAGTYTSGGSVPDTSGGSTNVVVLTLNTNNDDASLLNIKAAAGAVRDGDIVTLYGVNPIDYDGLWEVQAVDTAVNPPTVTLRCPPYLRAAFQVPFCNASLLPAYVSGGMMQSSGSMRAVVFESRGTDNTDVNFLTDWTHSFTNTDNDQDGWMDGPCETCHTQTSNHANDDYGNTHNNGRTCTDGCHWHSIGFDKGQDFCPAGRTCPPIN